MSRGATAALRAHTLPRMKAPVNTKGETIHEYEHEHE